MKKIVLRVAKCSKCGSEWIPRTAKPKKCPACQNKKWNEPEIKRAKAGPARKVGKR